MEHGRVVGYVMAGGTGSRLWPLSRADAPKPFLDLDGHGPTLDDALDRLRACPAGAGPIHVVADSRHASLVARHLAGRGLGAEGAILEREARGTAAVVALATLHSLSRHGDACVLVLPADHRVDPHDRFWRTIGEGLEAARAGRIVLIGLPPRGPEIGFGYVEASEGEGTRSVLSFREKPDAATARRLVASGRHFWNTGMLLFRAEAMRRAFAALRPDILAVAEVSLAGARATARGLMLAAPPEAGPEPISVDHAILERLDGVAMVTARFGWRDIGTWQALHETGPADGRGNVLAGRVVAEDCRDSYLRGEGLLVAAAGIEGLAIVATPDAVLVTRLRDGCRAPAAALARRDEAADADAGSLVGLRRWMFDVALPFWAREGVEPSHGGFHEALTMDGRPAALPMRTRTTARQIHAFATARRLGWSGDGGGLVAGGIAFLLAHARRPDGGWLAEPRLEGRERDGADRLYDTAAVLLALAAAHRSGDRHALALLEETGDWLEAARAASEVEGYPEGGPDRGGARTSNAHMHLLEAFLAAYRASSAPHWLDRARIVAGLCANRFVDAASGTLGEVFGARLEALAGPSCSRVEPGHQFEWASLLLDYARPSGDGEAVALARRLHAWAATFGVDRATGLVRGAVDRDGRPVDATTRSWMQAEALKAEIMLHREAGLDRSVDIARRLDVLRRHLVPAPPGLWIDRLGPGGAAPDQPAPASTLYHLVRVLDQPAGVDQ